MGQFGTRTKTGLGESSLHRHLTAFKAYFMVATRTRSLTFMAFAAGFADTGTNTATHAKTHRLGAGSRLQGIQAQGLGIYCLRCFLGTHILTPLRRLANAERD
jgi:hypothetical protein